MRVRVEVESKREKLVDATQSTDGSGATEVSYKWEIEHSYSVHVVDPKPEGWSMANRFEVLAQMLPPGTQCGDEFMVYFERAREKKG